MSSVEISLTESQNAFLELTCDYPLFVGGPGCGKSYLLGLAAVSDALHSPEANVYIYAPENHHIRTIEVPNVLNWLEVLKIKNKGYNKQENCIITEDPRCGNFYFKNMETAATIVGYESYTAHVDELDTLDEKKADEIWRAILMRNRQQPKGVPEEHKRFDDQKGEAYCINRARVYTTPEGYKFCYKNWELREHSDYQQVKGRTQDNPSLPSKYVDSIKDRYPSHVADAYLEGQFVNMESLAVYYNYDPSVHMSFEEVKKGEPLYIGCDFNVDNTSATVYVRRDGGREWHAVDEFVGVRDAATLAHDIANRYKDHHITMYPDASGRARNNASSANLSSIQELQRKGFTIRANKKNFLVDDRINCANKAFSEGTLLVNQVKCPTTSRCLVNQPYDKHGKPCKKTGYDHQNDATTYPIVYEMGVSKSLYKINLKWMV
jgi:hypothetical protein